MDIETRLTEIETRLAFQEKTLAELGEWVYRQRQELDALHRSVRQASADLLALRDTLTSAAPPEPPPPHY